MFVIIQIYMTYNRIQLLSLLTLTTTFAKTILLERLPTHNIFFDVINDTKND